MNVLYPGTNIGDFFLFSKRMNFYASPPTTFTIVSRNHFVSI